MRPFYLLLGAVVVCFAANIVIDVLEERKKKKHWVKSRLYLQLQKIERN